MRSLVLICCQQLRARKLYIYEIYTTTLDDIELLEQVELISGIRPKNRPPSRKVCILDDWQRIRSSTRQRKLSHLPGYRYVNMGPFDELSDTKSNGFAYAVPH
jgi:hypothetical protein